jgi:hypothetical protein
VATVKKDIKVRIYFSEIFDIPSNTVSEFGAFDLSLINDLPLFVDPFLLFNSEKPEYLILHKEIIRYVKFLRDQAADTALSKPLIGAWFTFPEVKQNWLGFSLRGNDGRGLGWDFAYALKLNLETVFKSFGNEKVTAGTHLEKLCLIKSGVGRDNVSDFTTNLIKSYLCEYTQTFARQFLHPSQRQIFAVEKAVFNYGTESWSTKRYELPEWRGDYVLLTPRDMLTKDETWISRPDLISRVRDIATALPNQLLKAQVDRYLQKNLHEDMKAKERKEVLAKTIEKFPELIEYYIKSQEESGDEAEDVSDKKVTEALHLFVSQIKKFAALLNRESEFYEVEGTSLEEARKRVEFMKDVIENKDGYRIFYYKGSQIQREEDLQILYRLTWYAATHDVNREPNNGRGPVDYAISKGASDKSLVEMKLASNKKLKQNLQNQVKIYEKANNTQQTLKVILYFSAREKVRVQGILKQLKLDEDKSYFLIDARRDNKVSASNAKTH